MTIKVGFNPIQSLKEFGRSIPAKLVSYEIKENEEKDYRYEAVKLSNEIFKEGTLPEYTELYMEYGSYKTWTPISKKDFKNKSKFEALAEETGSKVPAHIEELIYDNILTFFGIKSKYL